jgi:hypothetical protein
LADNLPIPCVQPRPNDGQRRCCRYDTQQHVGTTDDNGDERFNKKIGTHCGDQAHCRGVESATKSGKAGADPEAHCIDRSLTHSKRLSHVRILHGRPCMKAELRAHEKEIDKA